MKSACSGGRFPPPTRHVSRRQPTRSEQSFGACSPATIGTVKSFSATRHPFISRAADKPLTNSDQVSPRRGNGTLRYSFAAKRSYHSTARYSLWDRALNAIIQSDRTREITLDTRGLGIMAETKTILVVDDDMELSDGLRTVLERQGYRVIQARDGQQGKQAVYNHRPDLVILDMMMPRMGGYPVLEHFRDKNDAPPIIMITANEGSRHKAYAEYLGVIDYIRKPFAMERLLESVEKGLNRPTDPKASSPEADG